MYFSSCRGVIGNHWTAPLPKKISRPMFPIHMVQADCCYPFRCSVWILKTQIQVVKLMLAGTTWNPVASEAARHSRSPGSELAGQYHHPIIYG